LPKNVKIVLIGDSDIAKKYFSENGVDVNTFEYAHTTDVIEMAEHPTKAFTQKPNSSIALGFSLLKEKHIDAFASAGNTGAMLVRGMYTVKAISGGIRPCMTSILPRDSGGMVLVHVVSTNADCKPGVLNQFGILGSICAQEVYKIKKPRVGLL